MLFCFYCLWRSLLLKWECSDSTRDNSHLFHWILVFSVSAWTIVLNWQCVNYLYFKTDQIYADLSRASFHFHQFVPSAYLSSYVKLILHHMGAEQVAWVLMHLTCAWEYRDWASAVILSVLTGHLFCGFTACRF